MKNKKYRAMLVTPAFAEARMRKIKYDSSYGRVLPPGDKQDTAGNFHLSQNRCKTRDSEHEKRESTPREMSEVSETKDQRRILSPGSHFQSWKIPDRVVSAEMVRRIHLKDIEANRQIREAQIKTSEMNQHERKPGVLLKSENVEQGGVLPKIPNQRKKTPEIIEKVLKEDVHEPAKEWMKKSKKEDGEIAQRFLKIVAQKPEDLRMIKSVEKSSRKSSAGSQRSSLSSAGSGSSYKSFSSNCIHKTSSVAWRRDSTWLKPTKTFYQTWHGLPIYPIRNDVLNISSIYMRPHKKIDPCFTIHPEWGCKV